MAEGHANKWEAEECDARKVDTLNGGRDQDKLECAVCLQSCVHPVRLTCGHIFCYLCVKGVAHQSKRCAMCRKEIPAGYLEKPLLVNTTNTDGGGGGGTVSTVGLQEPCSAFADGEQWFYEGHNGWWQYDERTSCELEASFNRSEPTCELLIAGFLYVIDFGTMVQYRRNDPSRRRRIKRDLATIPKKGIAGLRFFSDQQQSEEVFAGIAIATPLPEIDRDRDGADGNEEERELFTATSSNANLQTLSNMRFSRSAQSPSPVPIAPNNTPQTPHTPSQDSGTSSPTLPNDPSLQEIIQEMDNLFLDSIDDSDTDDDGDRTEQRPCLANLVDINDEIL